MLTTGITEVFGGRFSCIDDLGGALRAEKIGTSSAYCSGLRAAADKYIAALTPSTSSPVVQPDANTNTQPTNVKTPEQLAAIARGKLLVQGEGAKGNCRSCHSPSDRNMSTRPTAFMFIPDDGLAPDRIKQALNVLQQRANEGFLDDLKYVLVDTKEMPPSGDLTDDERKDLFQYVSSLADGI